MKHHGSKKKAIKQHFARRLSERAGLKTNSKAKTDIALVIRNGKSRLIEKQSNSRGIHEIPVPESVKLLNPEFQGQSLFVVYDRTHHECVTVLLPEWVQPIIQEKQ